MKPLSLVYAEVCRGNEAAIGQQSVESLRHSDELAASYVEDPGDVRIYIDDLIALGLRRQDIFLASEYPDQPPGLVPAENFCHGFVSELYEQYLGRCPERKGVAAFACGPTMMMKAVFATTRAFEVPLKVFMEKRMACGIGVCLSCVCKTTDPVHPYARVCCEGPVFDAGDLAWD